MKESLTKLKKILGEIEDLNGITALMSWDQMTYMPEKGNPARGRQIALLSQIVQERQIDPEIGRLLDDLEKYVDDLPPDSDDVALIRVARRNYEQAIRIPPEFLARFIEHTTLSYQAWATARPENDFATMVPYLEKTLDYSRQIANFFPGYDHIADPLIDFSDYGMKAEAIRQIFAELRSALVPLVEKITAQELVSNELLHRYYPQSDQLAYGMEIVKAFGFNTDRGRMDLTLHPFMIKFAQDDVRITTRVDEHNLADNLFSLLHECGHALYELGIKDSYERTPLNNGTSSGVHESQSRLWENLVGRSRQFWVYQFPRLQAAFPDQLKDVSLDDYYRAINKVERSLIRTESDEVTYNLHVMIRFDLEMDMLEGKLSVADLPDAWNARYESDLGISPSSDVNGCMQDVHWFSGVIGGVFQGYTLGNIMSALFYDAAVQEVTSIPADIEAGRYDSLHTWLKDNVYQHGLKYTADELIQQTTGGSLTIEPYMAYLNRKFGEIYQLE